MTPASTKSQRGRILRLLIDADCDWVPLPEIMECAAQYNARVHELRKLGFAIENRTETDAETGIRHSRFRLLKTLKPNPAGEKPADSDYMRRRRKEQAQAAPLFAEVQQ